MTPVVTWPRIDSCFRYFNQSFRGNQMCYATLQMQKEVEAMRGSYTEMFLQYLYLVRSSAFLCYLRPDFSILIIIIS